MPRKSPSRRNNSAYRSAEKLEADLHKSWSVDQQRPQIRCDRHIGDDHPPRCEDCNKAEVIAAAARVDELLVRYIPNSSCSLHPDYPLPCNRCARDVLATSSEVNS
jgi:hypothetical protein